MSSRNIAVIVGSLRKGSYTRKVAQALVSLAPPNLAFRSIEIGDLPLYNEDLETAEPPQSWLQLRRPRDMLAELREDNLQLASSMRAAHGLCSDMGDVATTSLLEVWIDQAERRVWFLFEAGRQTEG